jgi:hypothetical protein
MAKEFEETLSHSDQLQETRRRSSVAASLGGGFQTVNIVKPLPTVTQSHEPQSGSTTFASKDLIAYYRPGSHWEGIHRYDEKFTWSDSEERHLVRKVRYTLHAVPVIWRIRTLTCGPDRLANLHLCMSHVLRTPA